MKTYDYKSGFRGNVPAQSVGDVLDLIEKRDGSISADAFVKAAKPVKSPIHNAFSWDDKREAALWRKRVARRYIRNTIQIERQTVPKSKPLIVKISERVNNPGVGYQSIEIVAADPDSFGRCLAELEGQISGIKITISALERAAKIENPKETDKVIALNRAFKSVDNVLRLFH